jgi:hypothetical protein
MTANVKLSEANGGAAECRERLERGGEYDPGRSWQHSIAPTPGSALFGNFDNRSTMAREYYEHGELKAAWASISIAYYRNTTHECKIPAFGYYPDVPNDKVERRAPSPERVNIDGVTRHAGLDLPFPSADGCKWNV